jgi:WD40 repeat protein
VRVSARASLRVSVGAGLAVLIAAGALSHTVASPTTTATATGAGALPAPSDFANVAPASVPPETVTFARQPQIFGASATPAFEAMTASLDGATAGPADEPLYTDREVSPDGKLVTYSIPTSGGDHATPIATCDLTCRESESGYAAGIAVAKPDGSEQRLLIDTGFNRDPAFSPDGEVIAYLSHIRRKGSQEETDALGIVGVDGKDLGDLVPPPGSRYAGLAWSPDGRWLATSQWDNAAARSQLVLVPLFGNARRVLGAVGAGLPSSIAWSHNGRAIVVARSADDPLVIGNDLWIYPVDGGPVRQLTHLASRVQPKAHSCSIPPVGFENLGLPRGDLPYDYFAYVGSPLWSPDDDTIAFTSSYGTFRGDTDIDAIKIDGSGMHTVWHSYVAPCRRTNNGDHMKDTVVLLGWRGGPPPPLSALWFG